MKRTPGILVGVLVAGLGLSGCAAPAEVDPTGNGPDEAAITSSRTSAFDIACDDVVPLAALQAIYGDGLAATPYGKAGAQGSWEMQGTALLQDGALACTWTREGKQRPAVVIIALDEGAEGFERSEQQFIDGSRVPYQSLDIADGAYTFCQDDGQTLCHWNVLAGDVWLSFLFGIVDENDENGLADGAIGVIIEDAIDALTTAPRNEVDRAEPTLPGCNETLTQEGVADALGVPATSLNGSAGRPLEYALGTSTPEFGQVMWAYSFERLGWHECTIQGETISFTSIVAPGAAWILDESGAVQPEVVEVADLGRGIDECRTEGDFTLCTVAVAVGEDLALVQLAPDDPARGRQLALAILRLLVE